MLLNTNNRVLQNDVNDNIFNATVLYTKKFKKTGRTLSLNVSEALAHNNADGYLKSEIDYYDGRGNADSVQRINQHKTTAISSNVLNTNLTYSEPLSKTFSILANYRIILNNSTVNRLSFNQSAPGNYDIIDQTLSNNYKLNQVYNQAGAIFNYKKGKNIINFGTRVADVNYKQQDLFNDNNLQRQFFNWSPQASYQHRFSAQRRIEVDYNGNNTQPTIDQIQPVRVNTDPLNIVVGNPNLRPSFSNSISANYNSYKIISGQSIYLYGYYRNTSNAIVSNSFTDSAGKSTFQSVNLAGKTPVYFQVYGGYNQKLNKNDLSAGANLSVNGNTYYSIVNNVLNMTKSYAISPRFRASIYKEKKIRFLFRCGAKFYDQPIIAAKNK